MLIQFVCAKAVAILRTTRFDLAAKLDWYDAIRRFPLLIFRKGKLRRMIGFIFLDVRSQLYRVGYK